MDTQPITSLKMICYRIYGTNDCFSKNPQDPKIISPLSPLRIDDFPDKDWKLTCFFGEIPDEIKYVHHSVKGFGLLCIQLIGNAVDNTKTAQEQLKECIQKVKDDSTIFTKYKWYTIEVFEKDFDIQNCEISEYYSDAMKDKISSFLAKEPVFNKNFIYPTAKEKLFGGDLLIPLEMEKEKRKFTELFNKVTICLMTEVPNYFFLKLMEEGCAFIINGIHVVGKPHLTSSAELNVTKHHKTLNQDKLISLIKQNGPFQNIWLNSVSHWYLAMLKEEDMWKKFYFGFVGLEILTHKVFKKIIKDGQFDVHLKKSDEYDKSIKIPVSDIIPEDTSRMTIAAKFSFVAGVLNPENYSSDRLIFQKCKETRDKISHGETIKIEELPINELTTLLDFYIQKMVMC